MSLEAIRIYHTWAEPFKIAEHSLSILIEGCLTYAFYSVPCADPESFVRGGPTLASFFI